MSDFSTFELGGNPCVLADGLLPQIARAEGIECDLSCEPTEEELRHLVQVLSPDDNTQRDAVTVERRLGPDKKGVASNWVVRSGILQPLRRPFVSPGEVPEDVHTIFWGGNVVDWLHRLTTPTTNFRPTQVEELVLPVAGARLMSQLEHPLVRQYALESGALPTEKELVGRFKKHFTLPGFDVQIVPVDAENREEVLDGVFESRPAMLDGIMLIMADAPDAVRAAGEVRLAARRVDPGFDSYTRQLYLESSGDPRPVARLDIEREPAHANPFGMLGRIARTALALHQNTVA